MTKQLIKKKYQEKLEKELLTSKNQIRSLQENLHTSEQVQRDFVELSQSLQVNLLIFSVT